MEEKILRIIEKILLPLMIFAIILGYLLIIVGIFWVINHFNVLIK